MNATQGYGSVQPHHGYGGSHHQQHNMATTQVHAATSVPPYSNHYHQAPPPLLQPGVNTYNPNYTHFPSYHTPATSPPSAGGHGHHYSHSSITLPAPNPAILANPIQPAMVGDSSGQIAPAGMKPKVTATLWEDEGTLCFQVEVRGICVARREDDHMINGTKLLNVAHMTRGRRDGILKSEKTRKVIKIGPMHLKGVWIPFERALDFANREKITDELYPLFVHNIGSLLQQPHNHPTAMASRRSESQPQAPHLRTPTSTTSAMSNQASSHLPLTPHSIAPYPGRPGLDRAQTFPTPPASATSAAPPVGNAYPDWPQHQPQPGAVEDRTRSLPTTPATTPPETVLPTLQPYSATQSFESQRSQYNGPLHQQQYNMPQIPQVPQYGPMSSHHYVKHEMAPPSRNGHDAKEEEGDNEYAHNNLPYGPSDRNYNYPPSTMAHERQHSEVKSSPSQQHPSGATPRTMATPHGLWPTYNTPQRSQTLPSTGSTYDSRPSSIHGYSAITPSSNSQAYSYVNAMPTPQSNKRNRDDGDENDYGRPASQGGDDLKRRKTDGFTPMARPRSTTTQRRC